MMKNDTLMFSEYLVHLMEHSGKTDRELAGQFGYGNQVAMIDLLRKGRIKLPLSAIPAAARSLDADPIHLTYLAMEEYMPEALSTIQANLGPLVTDRELEIIGWIRRITEGCNPALTDSLRERLRRWARDELGIAQPLYERDQ